jgi:hypothetical protein
MKATLCYAHIMDILMGDANKQNISDEGRMNEYSSNSYTDNHKKAACTKKVDIFSDQNAVFSTFCDKAVNPIFRQFYRKRG